MHYFEKKLEKLAQPYRSASNEKQTIKGSNQLESRVAASLRQKIVKLVTVQEPGVGADLKSQSSQESFDLSGSGAHTTTNKSVRRSKLERMATKQLSEPAESPHNTLEVQKRLSQNVSSATKLQFSAIFDGKFRKGRLQSENLSDLSDDLQGNLLSTQRPQLQKASVRDSSIISNPEFLERLNKKYGVLDRPKNVKLRKQAVNFVTRTRTQPAEK